jgi:predicted PurR-regulated permease PerM
MTKFFGITSIILSLFGIFFLFVLKDSLVFTLMFIIIMIISLIFSIIQIKKEKNKLAIFILVLCLIVISIGILNVLSEIFVQNQVDSLLDKQKDHLDEIQNQMELGII